jgi:hypothetical protein
MTIIHDPGQIQPESPRQPIPRTWRVVAADPGSLRSKRGGFQVSWRFGKCCPNASCGRLPIPLQLLFEQCSCSAAKVRGDEGSVVWSTLHLTLAG